MRNTYTHGNLTWIDLENPTREEIRALMDERKLPALVAEELLTPSLRPKVDLFPGCIYLILHFPAFRHTYRTSSNQEVDFVVGKDFIITTRYDTVDPLHKFSKVFEVNSILDRSDLGEHAGFILFYMVRKLYKAVEHELEYLSDSLKVIESQVFANAEREILVELSNTSRTILSFKQSLRNHRDILESLERAGALFFGEKFSFHLRSLSGDYHRVYASIQSLGDIVHELRETNNALLSTRQNEIMKIFTVIAFATLPLSLLVALFQIDSVSRPIIGSPGDFWVVLGLIGGLGLAILAYFRYKKWL